MANPISLRLADTVIARLARRAARAELPLRTLAQRYIDEGLRADEHPSIRFVDGPSGRRPTIVGTGLDVWEVIVVVRDNHGSVHEAARYLELPEALLRDAIAYYGAFAEEIDLWIQLNEEEAAEAQRSWLVAERALEPRDRTA